MQEKHAPHSSDALLIERLRQGDERAFMELVEMYHNSLVRIALMYVSDRATAEEVAQETWLGVLQGIRRFEGRSSLKTWLFRILTNIAKTRGARESRSIPFSALEPAEEQDEPAVDPARFLPAGDPGAGHWAHPPENWGEDAEARILSQETRAVIQQAIDGLPPNQRTVITLRDVEGWSAEEVCNALNIGETNQRVLLHRARAKVRTALEKYFAEE